MSTTTKRAGRSTRKAAQASPTGPIAGVGKLGGRPATSNSIIIGRKVFDPNLDVVVGAPLLYGERFDHDLGRLLQRVETARLYNFAGWLYFEAIASASVPAGAAR